MVPRSVDGPGSGPGETGKLIFHQADTPFSHTQIPSFTLSFEQVPKLYCRLESPEGLVDH